MKYLSLWRVWLKTYVLAGLAGWVAQASSIPLPWMIGPLFVTAGLRVSGGVVNAPIYGRQIGQWGVGLALGLYFTPAVVIEIVREWPFILASCILAFGLSAMGTYLLWRKFGVKLSTAYFSAAIGGASEMAVLAEKNGGQLDLVAAAHSLRVMIVVVTIPFAYQYLGVHGDGQDIGNLIPFDWLGIGALLAVSAFGIICARIIRLPNPFILGALISVAIITGVGSRWSSWPVELSAVAQLLIGVSLGVRFNSEFLRQAPRLVIGISVYTILSLLLSLIFAVVVSRVSGIDVPTMVLGTTPGGIAEMCITAKVLHLGVAVVTVFHVIRMGIVLVLTQPIYTLYWKRFE